MTPAEQAAVDALAPWVDTAALRELLERPVRVVVLGRTGAGKTSLLNRLTGQARPVGLGGVTPEVQPIPDGEVIWEDTPGIDEPYAAMDRLGPAVDRADGLIWVVDGLQPLTHTERQVVEALWPDGMPLVAVVSRADLLGPEAAAVLPRVAEVLAPYAPRWVLAHDLRPAGTLARSADRARLRGFARSPFGPRRAAELEASVGVAARSFAGIRPPVDPELLGSLSTVRLAVRARVDWLFDDPERFGVGELIARLGDEIENLRRAHAQALAADPALAWAPDELPVLPPLGDPGAEWLGALRLEAAGPTGAARELKGLAASWTGECDALLAEWAATVPADAAGAASWKRAREALDRLLGASGEAPG